MMVFKTSDIGVVAECQELFGFNLTSVQLVRHNRKFTDKLKNYRTSLFS